MFKTIAPTIIEDIRQRTDIVDTVGHYVNLKRSGQNYKGLCPFHTEKSPSFMVNPAKQIYKCFGCGAGGNVLTFLMNQNQQSFPEVLRELASQHGIHLEWDDIDEAKENIKTTLKKINEAALKFFEQNLKTPQGEKARAYLRERGVSEEMQAKFRLGFALDSWHALEYHLQQKGFDPETLKASGLFREYENRDGVYDLFRDRLIFPILSAVDDVVGFGGRLMSQEKHAKYINSPETALYQKGEHVYGLNHAKKAIRERDQVILSEGYLDAITAHQFGFEQTIAPLGTALTSAQARQVLRYTEHKEVLIAYDADAAGQKAAERANDVFNELKLQARVKIILMPEGMDPDTFLQSFGAESFQALVDIAQPIFEYQLANLLLKYDLKSALEKSDAAKESIEILLKINEPVYRDECLQQASRTLGIELNTFREQMLIAKRKFQRYQNQRFPKKSNNKKTEAGQAQLIHSGNQQKIKASEMGLLFIFLNHAESQAEVAEILNESPFSDDKNEVLRQDLLSSYSQGNLISTPHLLDHYLEPEMHQHIINILENEIFTQISQENQAESYEKLLADFSRNVKLQCLSLKLEQLDQEIKDAEKNNHQEDYAELMQAYMVAVKSLNDLKSQNL